MQLKFPVVGLDCNVLRSQSQGHLSVDILIIALLQGKVNGTFLEIGANHPYLKSDSWMLEKYYNWSGISVDLFDVTAERLKWRWDEFYASVKDQSWPELGCAFEKLPPYIQTECLEVHNYHAHVGPFIGGWSVLRPNTQFIQQDAVTIDYTSMPAHFDYLQIDIDSALPSLEVLNKAIDGCEFSIITFEHDVDLRAVNAKYQNEQQDRKYIQEESRRLLESKGYELLVNDVTIHKDISLDDDDDLHYIEDWWVNPSRVSREVIDAYKWIDYDRIPKYFYDILFTQETNK